MATTFSVVLPFGTPHARDAACKALDLIGHLERQLTVYDDGSEVSRLNRLAGRASVPVEPRLFGLLQLAARISEETAGAFDVTAGPLIKAWGFFERKGAVPLEADLTEELSRVGMRGVVLEDESRRVRFLKPGMEINLGSIGKGYALDRAAEFLIERGVDSALLNGGTSSVLAIGSPPNCADGWTVGIKHPFGQGRRLAVVRLRDRALATSAPTYQHFRYNDRTLGHLIDPRTGRPAQGMASATAVAPTAAEADALSTAFFVMGVEGTRAYCEGRPEIGAVLLEDRLGAMPLVVGAVDAEAQGAGA